MRVIIEARENGNNFTVALDVQSNNWLDKERNNVDRRNGIIDATNSLLRTLNLKELREQE